MEDKKQYRIGMGISIVLIMLAAVGDALSLIPFVGAIVGPIFWIIIGIYLWTKGMGILNGRKLAVTAVSFVSEIIPIVQELPMLLAGIIAILFIIRVEDKTGLSLMNPMKKGVTPPRLKKNPFNGKAGIRPPRKSMGREQSEKENLDMAA